ncbi:polysaccharide deacetylase family protein [Microtetraspora malaysiensis]|uniref:polysaccharide deacetylase family protein n=1 Tax=Microtetraspora malaysiensis TaxID=161358 RepID=UPI0012F97C6B|nr:polysaccharide deacetylase family protein [Microtetraspora malaysiensis]
MTELQPAIQSEYVSWSALPTRPRLTWPGGAKLAVCVLLHLEHAEFLPPAGTVPPNSLVRRGPYPALSDIHSTSVNEYGNRVGIFRVMDALDTHGVRATAAIDAVVASRYSEIVSRCRERSWELIGHATTGSRLLTQSMTEAEELAYLRNALDAVAEVAERRPRGWAGLDYTETTRTARLLAELGVDYVCDWPNDEQPYDLVVPTGRLTSLPVAIHLDDVFTHYKRGIPMDRWARSVREAFDQLVIDGAGSGRLLVLGLHPWLVGHPFRIGHVERVLAHMAASPDVWLATGSEVVDWFRGPDAYRSA